MSTSTIQKIKSEITHLPVEEVQKKLLLEMHVQNDYLRKIHKNLDLIAWIVVIGIFISIGTVLAVIF